MCCAVARRAEGPYRGFIHHRWIVDHSDGELMLALKFAVFNLNLSREAEWAADPKRLEIQIHGRGASQRSSHSVLSLFP
jgi:hypothetical protein